MPDSAAADRRLRRARLSSPPIIAAGSLAIALLVLGLWQLTSAYRLSFSLDSEAARRRIEPALIEAYRNRDADQLQQTARALLAEPSLRLTYLTVVSPEGVVLAVAERYQIDWPSWISDSVKRSAHDLIYGLTGRFERAPVAAPGSGIGQINFMVSPGLVQSVRDSAVRQLALAALANWALALTAAAGGLWLLRRWTPPPAPWVQRLDPEYRPPQMPFSAGEIEERVWDNLHQRAGSMLDEVGRGMLVVDRDAGVRYLNLTAQRLTGWALNDVIGRLVYSVFHSSDDRHTSALTPAELCIRENEASGPTEMRLRSRDGTQRPVEVMAIPLRRPNGSIHGAVMLFSDITDREVRIDQLRRQARLSQGVIDHLVEGVLTTDPAGVIRFANARALRMFGYSREDLDGVTVAKLMPVPFLNAPSVRITDYIGAERAAGLPKVVGWRRDATTFPVELVVQPMTIDHSQGLLMIVRDITERLRSENLAQRLGRLLDAAAEEVYIFDAQSLFFVEVNRGARRNLGYHPSEMTRMTPLSISEELDTETFLNYLGRLRSGESEHVTYRCKHRRADGSGYPVEVRLNFSREEEPPVFMAIAVDITEREQAEQRLRYLAHHDVLTGLPNRATLQDRLGQAMLAARRSNRLVAVLFMDVDRFKSFNDTYGHEVGDSVLRQVASRLSSLLRASDTVARLGGDEFVVIAAGLRAESDAAVLARKIQRTFDAPIEVPGQQLQVTLSIGVSIFPVDDVDTETLLHHADLAMYEAKQSGPGQFCTYQVDVSPERRRRIELERGIASALALDEFDLELLPIVDAVSGSVRALIAGLVWDHPEYGRVVGDEVVGIARRAGLQAEIELWRLRALCDRFADVDTSVPGVDRVSDVNPLVTLPSLIVPLSGAQLRHPDFRAQIDGLMQRGSWPRRGLIVASDADTLREARASAPELLRRLYAARVRLALLDDVASLCSALKQGGLPPLDLLMVDASYDADDLAADPVQAEALSQGLGIARASDVPTVVVGVNSVETAAWLRLQACSDIAGRGVQLPIASHRCLDWIETRSIEPL